MSTIYTLNQSLNENLLGKIAQIEFPSKFSLNQIREIEQTKFVHFRSTFSRISMYSRPFFSEIFVQFWSVKNRNFSISHQQECIFANKIRFCRKGRNFRTYIANFVKISIDFCENKQKFSFSFTFSLAERNFLERD